jgi:oligopeptide/dipeptide ABC transporter ATP-binding protein
VVRYISQRVAVMYLGRIVEIASREEIYHTPLHPYTQGLLKAIPQPDPRQRGITSPLSGELPDSPSLSGGCPSYARCPKAQPMCRQQGPTLKEVSSGHYVACLSL